MTNNNPSIFLPGGKEQIKFFLNQTEINAAKVLIIGANSEFVAKEFLKSDNDVTIIVDNYESLMQSRLILKDHKTAVKMMDYENTDFTSNTFDLIYAQASVSLISRNKIIKEIKRILKTDGIFCAGEIVSLTKDVPRFIKDIWESSQLEPLFAEVINLYYSERGFNIIAEKDLSPTLRKFYTTAGMLVREIKDDLSVQEKSYYKKILNKLSHESNVYLKLGGDKFIGFKVLVLKR